ncbi:MULTISPECIES: ABC transporter substrate-binding protein [unclassified Leucobacter]|uniref:ABC transporter substrate-binding protein n=1 Tax=unclassified Leucobacter TaxID=2621730 RepID=UPI000621C90B|nr:ABC transporter substrate-binding protein [Leucobacter sp. Ag1]KKI16272.1 ABC transporter substrate-binding protein [Leucobacter sp. Ag1]
MRKHVSRTLIGVAAVSALLLTGCSGGGGGADSGKPNLPKGDEVSTKVDPSLKKLLPEDIQKKGSIDIAVDIPFPPLSAYDANNREIGFDPELGRLLGQKLGVDVVLSKQAFDSVIPSMQAKKHDIIMSGMNDTPEREQTITYVDYTHGGFAILVKPGNPKKITGQSALCGKTVSVQKSTIQGELLRATKCSGAPVTVMELPTDLDALTALRAGKSDAYSADAVVADYVAATTDDGKAYEIVRDPENPAGFNPVYSGIGVLKSNTQLVDAMQKTLQALIDDGSYQKVLERNHMEAYGVKTAEVNQGGKAQ